MERFQECFSDLEDPRTGNARRHELQEVLFIALLANLCGAESCVDMAGFGEAKEELLRGFLKLEHGTPSHDTFSRIFRLVQPEAFHGCFQRFMAAFAEARGGKALDGKSLRRPLASTTAWIFVVSPPRLRPIQRIPPPF